MPLLHRSFLVHPSFCLSTVRLVSYRWTNGALGESIIVVARVGIARIMDRLLIRLNVAGFSGYMLSAAIQIVGVFPINRCTLLGILSMLSYAQLFAQAPRRLQHDFCCWSRWVAYILPPALPIAW